MIIGIASADRLSADKSENGVAQWGGSGWVRIGQYLSTIPHKVVVGHLVWKYDHMIVVSDDKAEHDPDVLIMQRFMHDGLANHMRLARAYGQFIINDIDDWYWGLSPSNNAWKASHPKVSPKENVNHYRSILASSDLVTVSTPYLADRIKSFVRNPIVLLENTVDTNRFKIKEHTDSHTPTIGWAGSTAHRSNDVETIASVLRTMHNNYNCGLMHVGHHPTAPSFADLIKMDRENIIEFPLLSSQDYPQGLIMDIGLVPLNHIPFNQAKSDIKGLEYSAAGIPFVAQSIDSYDALYKTTGAGRIAKNAKEWIKHLKALTDPEIRKEEGLANRELIKSRDIYYGAKRWNNLLSTV